MNKTLLKQIIDIFQSSKHNYLCNAIGSSNVKNKGQLLKFVESLYDYTDQFLQQNPYEDNVKTNGKISLFSNRNSEHKGYRKIRIHFLNWLYENNI